MELSTTAKRHASLVGVLLLVVALVVFASRAQGNVVPEPDLHDGGIWVTNEARGLVGRTNAQIATVDAKLSAGARDFDVLQSGNVVVVHGQDPPALSGVDPAQAALIPGPELSAGAQVRLGAGRRPCSTLTAVASSSSPPPVRPPCSRWIRPATRPKRCTRSPGRRAWPSASTASSTSTTGTPARSPAGTSRASGSPRHRGAEPARRRAHRRGRAAGAVRRRPTPDPRAGPGDLDVGDSAVVQEPGPAADTVLVAGGRRAWWRSASAAMCGRCSVEGPAGPPVRCGSGAAPSADGAARPPMSRPAAATSRSSTSSPRWTPRSRCGSGPTTGGSPSTASPTATSSSSATATRSSSTTGGPRP